MIRIVDYGLGNIQAFVHMFKRLGIQAERAKRPEDLHGATRLILPGVGAFDHAMQLLNDSGLRPTLERLVLGQQVPVIGVCVGMQMLASGSDEGILSGLDWVPGRVRAFANTSQSVNLPMPHMGWNDVIPTNESSLFKGLADNARFYFLHSYYFKSAAAAHVAAHADYGFQFDCAVQNGNIFGVQFHPEKSHHWGAVLFKNFAEL